MISLSALNYRTIDPIKDAPLVVANQRDACIASFGDDARFQGAARYLEWLASQVEEFPDGTVLALLNGRVVGHLELQVPYGLTTGYVNLYYVTPQWRGLGVGRRMHEYAERYFRSWEATQADLHVAPGNERAVRFYRALGYRFVDDGIMGESGLRRMSRAIAPPPERRAG